ncbi:MAG: ABC-F family ATP-binding cassette domain-containing protein [Micrococcaceae bacterium]
MAHLSGVENVTLSYGTRTILDNITIGVHTGDRIGVVGRNGDGKSSLISILAKKSNADSGQVIHRKDISIGYLLQSEDLPQEQKVIDVIFGGSDTYTWSSNPTQRSIIDALLKGIKHDALIKTLSGGQKRKLALAQVLVGQHDILILDEPTNHLDVEGIYWLAAHLKHRWKAGQGALVVVTHDRWFLDEVCTSMWEVHDGIVERYEGGYSAYTLAKAEREEKARVIEQKRNNALRKELAWLRRGAPARTSKPKFRIDAANELIADVPELRNKVTLNKMATARLGKDVIDLEDVSLSYGEQNIFNHLTYRLAPGERLGILGANGVGKSTFFKLLSREIEADSGRVKWGKTVQLAQLSQHSDELAPYEKMTVKEAIDSISKYINIDGKETPASTLLERFGFDGQKQWTKVKELSGGERRRLALLILLMGEPNVLLLDEPTNDLDIETLTAFEDLLDSWPGTLVIISHDRFFMERVTDHQYGIVEAGSLRSLPGGVEQYVQLSKSAEYAQETELKKQEVTPSTKENTVSGAKRRQLNKEVQRIEKRMSKIEKETADIHREMDAAATDYTTLAQLQEQLNELHEENETLEVQWLEIQEKLM